MKPNRKLTTYRQHWAATAATAALLGLCLAACSGSSDSTPAPSPATASPTPVPSPTPTPSGQTPESLTDVVYRQAPVTGGSKDLLLDVYQSGKVCDALRPFTIMVHGGGFKTGTKSVGVWSDIGEGLAARDIVGVAITYRLVGDEPIPDPDYLRLKQRILDDGGNPPLTTEEDAQLDAMVSAAEDLVNAIAWVQDNAGDLCVDPDRFALWGSSAGANLSMAAAYSLDDVGVNPPKPDVVIDYWGGQRVQNAMQPLDPPIFILHGDADPTVDYSLAVALQIDAEANGIPYTFYTVEGAYHGFGTVGVTDNGVDGKTFLDLSLDFVEAHLLDGLPLYEVRSVPALAQPGSAVAQDLNAAPLGVLTNSTLNRLFNTPSNVSGVTEQRVAIVDSSDAFEGHGLAISLPSFGLDSGNSGAQWVTGFNSAVEEAFLSYRVRFAPGFDFSISGTLPGLGGGDLLQPPTGSNGWRAPMIWQSGGRLAQRLVTPAQSGQFGDEVAWTDSAGAPFALQSDTWYTVEHRVVMNTPGQSDGIFEATVNGELALRQTGLRYRDTSALAIDAFLFSAFYGGGGEMTQPTNAGTIFFDDFAFSTQRIGQE